MVVYDYFPLIALFHSNEAFVQLAMSSGCKCRPRISFGLRQQVDISSRFQFIISYRCRLSLQ